MNFIKKYLFSIFFLCLLFLLISVSVYYESYIKDDSSGHMANVINGTEQEQDTIKRIQTHNQSNTNWGMSPFGSGKPISDALSMTTRQSQNIIQNRVWKSKILNIKGKSVVYTFGNGNPIEADPLSDVEQQIYRDCIHEKDLTQISCGNISNQVTGYVTSKIESDIELLIKDPIWINVLSMCESQFRQNEYPDWGVTYDDLVFYGLLDIEKMIIIDENTGRKEVHTGKFPSLRAWFLNVITERKEIKNAEIVSLQNCVTQNGGLDLLWIMDRIQQGQFYPN